MSFFEVLIARAAVRSRPTIPIRFVSAERGGRCLCFYLLPTETLNPKPQALKHELSKPDLSPEQIAGSLHGPVALKRIRDLGFRVQGLGSLGFRIWGFGVSGTWGLSLELGYSALATLETCLLS